MSSSVDLTNLREMTEGDREMEEELFAEFFSSSEEGIATMETNCVDGENEAYRANAHALKGTSINMGAAKMGKLYEQAQENYGASAQEKQAMLADIKSEYVLVKAFLEQALRN